MDDILTLIHMSIVMLVKIDVELVTESDHKSSVLLILVGVAYIGICGSAAHQWRIGFEGRESDTWHAWNSKEDYCY